MDEITKGMEELVKMSKDMLDLSEEIKRDVQKMVGEEIHEDSGQMEQERDDFHAGQEEQQRNNNYE